MHQISKLRGSAWALSALLWLAGCGGGGGDGTTSAVAVAGAPVIAQQPAAATVDDGGSVSFSAAASGDATIAYQWLRNGVAIAGATATTLTLTASYGDNGAAYSLRASNGAGSTTSNAAALTVRPLLPTVASAPQSANGVVGATQTFGVTMSGGTQPLRYQWQRDGVDIAGATAASYTTPVLAAGDDAAVFRVRVDNPAGSVFSTAATLSVGSAFGQLVVTGPGTTNVGGGGSLNPAALGGVSGAAPVCAVEADSQTRCTTTLTLGWNESSSERLLVMLYSSGYPSPGVAAGTGINGINLTYSTSGAFGLSLVCTQFTGGCDFGALGIVLDPAQRTLSFNNTPGTSIGAGGGAVLLNGTLRY